jgi:hypothetical protein
MTGPAQALAIRLNPPSPHEALYPPCRQHPSDSAVQRYHTAKATASRSGSAPCSPCKQHCTTKLPVSCSRSARRFTSKIPHRGHSPTPSKMVYSIFHPAPSTASTSSLTQGSLLNPGLIGGSSMNSSLNNPSTLSTRKTPLRSRSITRGLNERRSLSRQCLVEDRIHPTDVLQPDKSPPLSALNLPTTSKMNNHQPSNSPWVSASDAHRLARIAKKLIDEKAAAMARIATDLEEVRRQKERFANMEAWLLALSQPAMDQGMEDCEESAALRCHSNKTSLSSTGASTSAAYS